VSAAAAVDAAAVARWLHESAPTLGVARDDVLHVQALRGGYSNLTFAITLPNGRRVVLRRAPVGVRAERGAHDMRREFRVLHAVYGTSVPVPQPLVLCEDESVIGGMFYIMSAVDGVVVRSLSDAPALRNPAVMRRMSEACVDGLAALHALPVTAMPLFDAAKVEGYGARQVAGFAARWSAARPPDVSDDDARVVFAWLTAELPAPIAPALLHNDWKFDNLVLDPTDAVTIRGVLDWEMSSVGDPRFDLATSLGYWVEQTDHPALQELVLGVTTAAGCLTRAEVVSRYERARGVTITRPAYWYVFGLAKLAVIVVQLYARYVAAVTRDARFAGLGGMAALLMRTARGEIAREGVRSGVR
jgi:aminoglycoside phosphotransferase (APT) family kinase protein